jgi:hypothetical protein
MATTVSSASDLRALRANLKSPAGAARQYEFALPGLSAEENSRLGALMNSYANECGCNSGSFVMSAGVTGIVIHYFATGGHWADLGRAQWLWLVAWTAAFALAGKAFGIIRARWRMLGLAGDTLDRISRIAEEGDRYGSCMQGNSGLG